MQKEMDTSLRDFTPLRPSQKSNLALPFAAVLLTMLVLWWVLIARDPHRPPSPRPVLAAVEKMTPPLMPRLLPPPPAPPRPLTELELLEQLNTAATEQLWTARAAVLIIGLGVLGIFTVSRRLTQLGRAHDREIDLLMGIALGQQRDLLTQLGEGLAGHSRSPPWDDPPR